MEDLAAPPAGGLREPCGPAGLLSRRLLAYLGSSLAVLGAAACSGSGRPSGPTSASSGASAQFLCESEAPVDPGPAPLLRLTSRQYEAAARALFGPELKLGSSLPPGDSVSHMGLVQADPSEVDAESYALAAERIGTFVRARVEQFAPCPGGDGDAAKERRCATDFLRTWGPRIYRGPLSDDDLGRLLWVYEQGRSDGTYASAIGWMAEAMTQSPRFVYRPELGDAGRGSDAAIPLTAHELATRLSFAFWNEGPDAELLKAAEEGALDTEEGILEQAQRLSEDPRAHETFRGFLRAWFGLDDLGTVEKDPEVYPLWSDAVRGELGTQADRFFDAVLTRDGGKLGALFTLEPSQFASEKLSAWQSDGDGAAQGVLVLPAVLSRHAKPTESFPIYRGLFVREQLLCQALPSPPANVGDPPEPVDGVSSRERFAEHSSNPGCKGCHRLMDPIGFAFENYDGIGRFRTVESGHPVDPSGTLTDTDVDGRFANLSELSDRLARSDAVRACSARQWFRFVMQRFEQPIDGCSMKSLADAYAKSGYRLPALRTAIVKTAAFRMRRPIVLEGDKP